MTNKLHGSLAMLSLNKIEVVDFFFLMFHLKIYELILHIFLSRKHVIMH